MSLTNPNTPVSQQDLQDFYHKILPYMGGSSTGGGGHTIEDSEGTDLTQRDTLQFGEGFKAEDDDTNKKTVITPYVMQSGDMSDIITPLPTVQPRYQKYSTEEQIVGEWIDGKPIYQKTIVHTLTSNIENVNYDIPANLSDIETVAYVGGIIYEANGTNISIPLVSSPSSSNMGIVSIGVISASAIQIRLPKQNLNSGTKLLITIQYTKTTD